MNKYLVFDMDGTIADLYHVEDWKQRLDDFDPQPYIQAKKMFDQKLIDNLLKLKSIGYQIIVTSWLSKTSNYNYDRAVTSAKFTWLRRSGFPVDQINIVPYGTPKHEVTKELGGDQILFDDNKEVRKSWNLGKAVSEKRMKRFIKKLVKKEGV